MSDGTDINSVEQLERVRDILFGSTVRELKQDVTLIQEQMADLQQKQQELQQSLQAQGKSQQEQSEVQQRKLSQTLSREMDGIRQRLEEVQQQLSGSKVDRQGLAHLLGDLARRLEQDAHEDEGERVETVEMEREQEPT